MKNKKNEPKNYLERIPLRPEGLSWSKDDEEIVTFSIENKGFFNKIAQRFFKKPKTSYIHLDKIGSLVWCLTDGEKDIIEIGELVREKLGDEAEPVYERLAKYYKILDSYGFIQWKNEN